MHSAGKLRGTRLPGNRSRCVGLVALFGDSGTQRSDAVRCQFSCHFSATAGGAAIFLPIIPADSRQQILLRPSITSTAAKYLDDAASITLRLGGSRLNLS